MSDIINKRSLSFDKIKSDLIAYINTKPDASKWKSYFESNSGVTVLELISGLGVYRSYHELVRRRESYLDTAGLETSIHELAFTRGFIIPPADGGEIQLSLDFKTDVQTIVHKGDLVGTVFDYDLYSVEDKVLNYPTDTLSVVPGWLEEFEKQVSTAPFSTIEFLIKGEVAVSQLEELLVVEDEETINLKDSADLDLSINLDSGSFMLRRWKRNKIKLYTGNGILGWFTALRTLRYRVVSYNLDIIAKVQSQSPQLKILLNNVSKLRSYTVLREPSDGLDKELVRNLAEFYPADGRIVRDRDYELIILKYHSDKIYDVYSFNSDPNQEIYLIKRDDFDTTADLDAITETVDYRRGMGIRVNYYTFEKTSGKTINLNIEVEEGKFTNELTTQVREYLDKKLYKFMRVPTILEAIGMAVELSAEFGVKFEPTEATETDDWEFEATDFISAININYS